MPSRALALLAAVLLLWSCLGTIEAPVASWGSASDPGHAVGQAEGPAVALHEGTVAHHHLDDLPSQSQADPPADHPGPLPAVPERAARALATSRPQGPTAASMPAPWLAGLLRPPCDDAVAG
jgi:hypothetical protein